jgi:serine protease AprX
VIALNFVKDAVVYHPDFVIRPDLKNDNLGDEADIVLSLHDDVEKDDDIEKATGKIASLLGIPESDVNMSNGAVKLCVPRSKLRGLAQIDEVKVIAGYAEPTINNNVACKIMEVDKAPKGFGLKHESYKGQGQVVCVADTGFDKGTKDDVHSAFQGRVDTILAPNNETARHDFDGHGTHVAGSVLGKGNCKHKFQDGQDIEGPASAAHLVFQALSNGWNEASKVNSNGDKLPEKYWRPDLGRIPAVIGNLFEQAYNQNARIHTNSWGLSGMGNLAPQQSIYLNGGPASLIDDYLLTRPDMVVLFSASNDGIDLDNNPGHVDPGSLSFQACAKNVITVGASESVRADVVYDTGAGSKLTWGLWRNTLPSNPIAPDDVANNAEGLAGWSSRGPAWLDQKRDRGRIKPDIVAPGTTILSARSRGMSQDHLNEFWGKCSDPDWMFEGGTSMATPLVAGCCAVIRGALVDPETQKVTTGVFASKTAPSAALVKAILINGAVSMKGQYGQDNDKFANGQPNGEFGPTYDRPNYDYGFGRVNLNNSIQHIFPGTAGVTAGFGDMAGKDAIGKNKGFSETYSFTVVVPASGAPQTLKVTMAYQDKGSAELDSNLNLLVEGSGTAKHGNKADGDTTFDDVNNVEQVKWKNIKAGNYKVTIIAQRTGKSPQAFAYAWRLYPGTS